MYYLGVFKFLSDISDVGILGAITNAFRSLFYTIDSIVYELIVNLYNLFEILCNSRILDDEVLEQLTQRVGVLLGVIMFFMVTFSAIKMLIEPDTLTDKNKGAVNIVKKVLIVIVMLGSSSFVFSGLYSIQTQVIQSGIITKVLMPKKINTDNFGGALSASLLTSFYSVNPAFSSDGSKSTDIDVIDKCEYYVNLLSYRIYHYNDFELGYNCLNEYVNVTRIDEDGVEGEESEMYVIKYTPIISTAVGLAVAYFLLMYCITVGVRTVQLAFLEVISPMAIIAYLSPKDDNMFKKWLRVYVSTYLDVFIRIAIINFAAFLIATILDNSSGVTSTFWSSVGDPTDFFTRTYLRIAIILALLTFAKKAPDLIKELFPMGGSKLGFGTSMKDIVGLSTAAKVGTGIVGGALGGTAIGLLSGSPGGMIGGFLKGGLSGLKGQGFRKTTSGVWKSERDSIKKMRDIRAQGGSWFGSHVASLQGALGMRNAYENDEAAIANSQVIIDTYNDSEAEAKSEAIKNRANYSMISHDGRSHTLAEYEKLAADQSLTAEEQAKYGVEYDKLLKSATQFNLDYGAAVENSTAYFDANGSFSYVRSTSGNTYNSNNLDSMSSGSRENLLGSTNAKIEVGMNSLGGKAHSGRGKKSKDKRNAESTYIHELKNSDEHKKRKANAGK